VGADVVPPGFAAVCVDAGWDTAAMWKRLNGSAPWFRAANEAYVYFNRDDQHWWVDAPSGHGVFKARGPAHAPPSEGWAPLRNVADKPPAYVATFRDV